MQTVTPATESETTSTSRLPRSAAIALAVAGIVLVLLVVAFVALRAARADVLPNVVLAGERVGGMDHDSLTEAVTELDDRRSGDMVTAELDDDRRSATAGTIGYDLDVDATVDKVWRRGRQVNPAAALTDHVRATLGEIAVEPVTTVDRARLDRWVRGTVAALERPAVVGSISFDGATVVRSDPQPGTRPSPDTVRAGTLAALDEQGPATVAFETEAVEPQTTSADVDDLVELAQRVVSAPVELTRNGETLELKPRKLAALFAVEQRRVNGGVVLDLSIGRPALADVFDEKVRTRFEVEPKDATVELTRGGPKVREGRDGFAIDLEAAQAQIDDLARTAAPDGEARTAKLQGTVVEPERTTKEARDLEITQKVSSFTTNHACCQGRVTNIHRFADIVDGALIEPGEVFSLNEHVGKRTAAKGFVGGGAIQKGEYVEEVGGGVSQFATTFFNAAFFGGYEIVEHKPHSYYISRYPAGRESTINWPTVDVKIRNNSPYGILVDTSYSGTSITVTFWGNSWVKVTSATGEPHNHSSPETRVETNPSLAPGTERVVQSGGNGFDIVVTRTLRYDDGETETQEFFTRYLAEPRIIERGPDAPADDGEG